MRIAIVSDTLGGTISGIERGFVSGAIISTLRFINGLAKKNHNLLILTSKMKGFPKTEQKENIKIIRFRGFPIPKTGKEAYISIPFLHEIIFVLKKNKIDIVHIQEPTIIALTCIIAAKILKIPVVSTLHVQGENILYNLGFNPKKKVTIFLNKIITKNILRLINLTDIAICPSKFAIGFFQKMGLNRKTCVVSNGIDLNRFNPKNSNFKKKLNLEKKKVILYVGRIAPEKNINVLIKALDILVKKDKNYRLIIVGSGLEKNNLEILVKKLNLSNFVHFTSKVSDSDLPKYYSTGNVFVLPSLVELQGMVILEAMATGLPIIIAESETSAGKELVDNNGYVFDPFNCEELANKIKIILNNKKLKNKFSENSLKIAKEHSFDKSIIKLEKIYKNLIKK